MELQDQEITFTEQDHKNAATAVLEPIEVQSEIIKTEEIKPEEPKVIEPPKVGKEKQALVKPEPIEASQSGIITGSSFEAQYRLARVYLASKMLPQAFDTPEKIFTAMQFAYELGLKGITAMRNICVINGTPSLWGNLPLALVKRSGKLKSIKEWSIDSEKNKICPENNNTDAIVHTAFCETTRVDGDWENIVTTWFSEDDARKAKLLGNPKKPLYEMYRRRMFQMRARGQNLNDNFGDVLGGASIAEYDHHAVLDKDGKILESDSRPIQNVAGELNEAYLEAPKAV